MADVFISYATEDVRFAYAIGSALTRAGLPAFVRQDKTPGDSYAQFIQQEIENCRCVLTIWTERSAKSRWVMAESSLGVDRGILMPIVVGYGVQIPVPFNLVQTEHFEESDFQNVARLSKIVDRVRAIISREKSSAQTPPGSLFSVGLAPKPAGGPVIRPSAGPTTPRAARPDAVSLPSIQATKKAFISYASQNEDLAIKLVEHLENAGCPCWISFRDVDAGDDYRTAITRAMDEISFLVLIYSEHANTSFDIATELLLARKRGKRRFVLKTDQSEPAGPVEYELGTVQWINCQNDYEAGFDKIAQRARLL